MKLRDLRIAKNMMQKELAEALNISQQTISKYETGQRSPDLETVIRIADYFKVPIDYLLERKSVENLNFKLPEEEYLLIGDLTAESKKELIRFLELLRKAEKSDQKHE